MMGLVSNINSHDTRRDLTLLLYVPEKKNRFCLTEIICLCNIILASQPGNLGEKHIGKMNQFEGRN